MQPGRDILENEWNCDVERAIRKCRTREVQKKACLKKIRK
jgi:hypothetical protein